MDKLLQQILIELGEQHAAIDDINEQLVEIDNGVASMPNERVWGDDELVGVDAAATPGYLGAAGNDGVLRVDSTLDYSDGGDFVTLSVASTYLVDTVTELNPYTPDTTNDRIVIYDQDNGALYRVTPADFADLIEASIDHGSLAGLADDDHTRYVDVDGSATRNSMTGVLGDSSNVESVDPPNRQLNDSAGGAALDWSSATAFAVQGASRPVTIACTTVAAVSDGALEVTGGIYCGGGIYAVKGTAVNGAGYFSDGSNTTAICDASYCINATGDINATGSFVHNGTAGWDGWFDDGTNFRVTVNGGIITDITNSSGGGYA